MRTQPVTAISWQAGATASDPIYISRGAFNRIFAPAGFQGATLTFQCAIGSRGDTPASGDYRTMQDREGNVLSIPVAPTAAVVIVPDLLHAVGWFRLLAATAQTVARTVQLVHPSY
jgi:hypothetical protein